MSALRTPAVPVPPPRRPSLMDSRPLPPVPFATASVPPPRAVAEEPADLAPAPSAAQGGNAADIAAVEPRQGRRLPHPPGKRSGLWLGALVAGGVVAAVVATSGGGATDVARAADYGLGSSAGVDASGSREDLGVRQGITEAEARARLTELAASRAAREPKTVLPAQGEMSTCFCKRWGKMHWGIDLAAPLGTPILAATDGVVLRAGPASGYGNAVYVEDADGNVEIYGHMRYYNVKAGDVVHAGDQIAKVGNEGESTGPHLHFQIDRGSMEGTPIDPQAWLQQRGVAVPGA